MAVSPQTQEIYDKVTALITGGMNTRTACATVAEEVGRPAGSVATTYYRMARRDPGVKLSSKRGRPRKKDATPSAPAPVAARPVVPAGTDPLAALSAEMTALREENARLTALLEQVRNIVR